MTKTAITLNTLADLKLAMTVGRKIKVTNHLHPTLNGERTVIKTHETGIRWYLSLPTSDPNFGQIEGSWIGITAESYCTFSGNSVTFWRDASWNDNGPFCTIELLG